MNPSLSNPSPSHVSTVADFQPNTIDAVIDAIRQSVADGCALITGRSRLAVAAASSKRIVRCLSLRSMADVVDYPARDMTITVQAGMMCSTLSEILRAEQQQLPIDIADPAQTIGGLVAEDFSGPRRFGYGTLRDYVIGLEAVDGSGRLFHAGGRVVKNVAGYDLCRLLIGTHGSLAVLTQLTFKLKPLPAGSRMLLVGFRRLQQLETALEELNRSAAAPVILDVLNRDAAAMLFADVLPADENAESTGQDFADCQVFLVIGIEGTEEACHWQISVLQQELQNMSHCQRPIPSSCSRDPSIDRVASYCRAAMKLQSVNEQSDWIMRLSTLPSRVSSTLAVFTDRRTLIIGRAGNGVLYFRPTADDADDPSTSQPLMTESECHQLLSTVVTDGMGSVSHCAADGRWTGAVSADESELMNGLRTVLDPQRIFSATVDGG